jgi:hypothetical protein
MSLAASQTLPALEWGTRVSSAGCDSGHSRRAALSAFVSSVSESSDWRMSGRHHSHAVPAIRSIPSGVGKAAAEAVLSISGWSSLDSKRLSSPEHFCRPRKLISRGVCFST